jgi:uncharacterized membrane protein YbaN (DUF454 family)
MRAWLLAHPRFGPQLGVWFDHGIVPRRAKVLASIVMGAGSALGISTSGMSTGLASVVVLTLAAVLVWLWLRPESVKT